MEMLDKKFCIYNFNGTPKIGKGKPCIKNVRIKNLSGDICLEPIVAPPLTLSTIYNKINKFNCIIILSKHYLKFPLLLNDAKLRHDF